MQENTPHEVTLSPESIALLEAKLVVAVVKGITLAIDELQEKAVSRVGGMVLSGFGALIKKVCLFTVFGGIVYAFGGWNALDIFFKTFFTDFFKSGGA